MSRVLVTGGAGFVGSHVVRALMNRGEQVFVLDYFHRYTYPIEPTVIENTQYRFDVLLDGAEIVYGTTTLKEDLRRYLVDLHPDHVLHLAGLPLANTALRQSEEAFGSIVGGTVNMLEILRDSDCIEKFVFVSSSMVYGDFTTLPMPEEGLKAPKEIYGGMKLASEILVSVFGQRYGIPYAIVRPSAVYGPTDNNRRVLQVFVEKAMKGETLTVNNPETTVLDFSYVTDVAEGLASVLLSPTAVGEAFNITCGTGRSLAEAIGILHSHFPGLKTAVAEDKDGDFRPIRGALDISKARELVGYVPTHSLEDGLARYVEFVRVTNPSLKPA